MLESESRDLSTIHISLHVIRLGADGTGVTTSQKVEDESTRSDFKLISGSSRYRYCKIFSKELASSQSEKTSPPRMCRPGDFTHPRAEGVPPAVAPPGRGRSVALAATRAGRDRHPGTEVAVGHVIDETEKHNDPPPSARSKSKSDDRRSA